MNSTWLGEEKGEYLRGVVCGGVSGTVGGKGDQDYLPMHSEAIDEDWVAFLSSRLAKSFEEDQDAGGLQVVEPCIVTHHDVVENDVDVGDVVRMKGCQYLV